MTSRRVIWLLTFATAMAYLESAVVVYLREIYYRGGFAFPIVIIPDRMAAIEVGRQAATIVMLIGVALLAGSDRWERFLCFCLAFGVWDILYYVWLKLLVAWPESFLTWDILFLIPVPWIAPVLAPLIVAIAVTAGSGFLLRLKSKGRDLSFHRGIWALAIAGGIVVILSFTLDFRAVLEGRQPLPFPWWLFGAGMAMAVGALAAGTMRLRKRANPNL
jgi:hypothetical protein